MKEIILNELNKILEMLKEGKDVKVQVYKTKKGEKDYTVVPVEAEGAKAYADFEEMIKEEIFEAYDLEEAGSEEDWKNWILSEI